MSFSQTVHECVSKGWGQGEQHKMIGYFGITREMADKVAMAAEDAFVQRAREHKAACEAKYKHHPMKRTRTSR